MVSQALFLFIKPRHILPLLHRYVEIGETPITASIRQTEEQTRIIIPSNTSAPFSLIGVYNDPSKDLSEELRSTIIISHAIEYDSSAMVTNDGTGIPKATSTWNELVLIPLEEVGTTYTQEHFEEDHFSFLVLLDLKVHLLGDTSTRRDLRESENTAFHSTC